MAIHSMEEIVFNHHHAAVKEAINELFARIAPHHDVQSLQMSINRIMESVKDDSEFVIRVRLRERWGSRPGKFDDRELEPVPRSAPARAPDAVPHDFGDY